MVPKDLPDDELPDDLPDDEDEEFAEEEEESNEVQLETFQDLPGVAVEEATQKKIRPLLEDIKTARKYEVPTYPMFIGRDKKSSICIPEAPVSRRHAKVFERDGAFFIQDFGSINGTYLNEKRIMDPVELKDGDRIKIAVTKQFSRGVREYVFKHPIFEEVTKEQREQAERDALLKQVGISGSKEGDRKKVLLRHCIFKIARHDLISMLITEGTRRVSLTRLELNQKILSFLALMPFKPKDTLMCTIEHPRLSEALRISVRVTNVIPVPNYGAYEHQTEVVKLSDKHKAFYDNMIKLSPLICYLTSKLKE
jgi:pSer/pThr/pTyr-binding forkhead associated (FHA) protein